MNAALLQQHLSGNSDALFRILETLEFQHINLNNAKTQFRFSRLEDSNPTSMMLDVNTLRYYCFSTNGKGNLFTLIMDRIHCTFPQSLQFVANILDLDTSDFNVQVTYPFHGFYRKLLPDRDDDFTLPTIPETTLDPYLGKYNTMFFQDGIDYKTQELFQVGYDEESSRITIPERDFNGNLVGIMGRSNDPTCKHEERWLPLVPCSRSKTLFGLQQNYHNIIDRGNIFLFESEKAPMQARSFGCRLALGLCGCHVSHAQATMIASMLPKNVVLALDEGLEEEAVREEAKKLVQDNIIVKTKVGYVWDADSDIIPKGSKLNAADLGVDAYKQIMRTKVRWLT